MAGYSTPIAAADWTPLAPASPLEIWGGVECSVVRVGSAWRDQIRETGHQQRPADLDLIAGLGIRTIRYPLLWERLHEPGPDWDWLDSRMAHIRRLGMRVVGGLVHHGSGPVGTSLLDPSFPEKLARHAAAVAERYPDILDWTPVNEPLTTARFSCLYGFWYPHMRDLDAFLRATVIQCRAVLLAMRSLRARQPSARLVQTEDIGRIFATSPMREQADHENERRWLSLDLLCGRVTRDHPLWAMLRNAGVNARDLGELASGEAAPDVIGVNHYVTSDRFLDHRTALYPPHLRGGNGRAAYADTEAVRVNLSPDLFGWLPRLREVWHRYRRPIAITEAQLGGEDGEEQLRWFMEAWRAAEALRADGADIRAVTAWAMVGAVDWDSLLCQVRGNREAGAWNMDPAGVTPRPIARALASLAATGVCDESCLEEQGWWRRHDRVPAIRRHG